MSKNRFFRLVGIILLGSGIFQIVAAGIAAVFWIVSGDWRNLVPQIIVIAFWITLPISYFLWQRMFAEISK